MTYRLPLAFVFLIGLAAPSWAQQQPLPKVPDGFKVEIVLQAPDIEAPTALCVAPNGDVYFAEDPMDMSGPPTKNIDKIWMLKGGDPKKKVLIADQMWAVMGLEIVRDKLYVVHAPYVTVFTLDADGKPKAREDLFTDLGPKVAGVPGFNDHIPSGIRMGMDGYLYVSIGDKGIPKMTRKEKDQGSVHVFEGQERRSKEGNHISLEGGGIIRFRPDGSGLEVFASGTRNHLDVPLDEHDRIFLRDNTDDGLGWNTRFMYVPPGAFMGYPWAYKKHPKETLPMIHDFGGGSPCQGFVYCDDGLPEMYRGRVFHCEWGKGQVLAVKVVPEGGGFKYVDEIKFIDPAGTAYKDFRPFSIRPLADGKGFYVTDWGFNGWLSKTKAGRLLKVTYAKDDVKPAPRGKDDDKVEDLIRALDHPAHSERLRAQWTLASQGKEAYEAARTALGKNDLGTSRHIHLLWVLRHAASGETLAESWLQSAYQALRHADPEVRMEAARVVGSYRPYEMGLGKIAPPVDLLLGLLAKEKDARVRLQAAAALRDQLQFIHSAKDLLAHLDREADQTVRHVAVKALKHSTARSKDLEGKVALNWRNLDERYDEMAPKQMQDGGVQALVQALQEEYELSALRILQRLSESENALLRKQAVEGFARVHHDRKPYTGGWWGTMPAGQKPPARNVAWEGTPRVRSALLKALADKDAEVRKAAVAGLMDMNDPEMLEPLIKQYEAEKDVAARTDLVQAIAGVSSPKVTDFLSGLLLDGNNSEAALLEAIRGLERSKEPQAAETLAKVATKADSVTLQARALEALGNIKAKQTRSVAEAALKSADSSVRKAAAIALAKLGDATVASALLPLLQDKEAAIRTAAIQALGTLQAKSALPALIQATGNEATQFDAIAALAKMPDARALTAYLTGLGSKNADLRIACRQAIIAVRDEAAPVLEQLVKRNEVRADLIAELRTIYSSFTPVLSWRLIGPFANDGKAHPPEMELKFDATYKGVEKEVKWQTVPAEAKNHGKVDLLKLLRPSNDVVAYAYAEIESATARDATLLAGSDDTIIIWLNGKKVHSHLTDRGWKHDSDKVNVKLEKGKNALLIQCGNHGGGWEFSVALSAEADRYAFLKGGAQKFNLQDYRAFAAKNKGDAERGGKLFMDAKGVACVKCHAVGGQGGQVGPDLAGIALKYKKDDLMTSILEPSKVIAQGYETIVVATKDGKVLTGVFKGESGDAVDLADAEGKRHSIAKKDIDERSFSPVSIMPNGLNEGMTLQDFADLVAYLEARREEMPPAKK